ncbi:conjugative transposon protein TraK [Parapedobacter sp. 10938]|uniref:conjugative transposon protein TraK n=1 Tax=Parapedobacter flavus TaxID=3110225 RepID=UPI002DBD8A41|nr:conjugative transposon protein TraK [Parapedobacter sp. 10938]MEC3881832.1 conjugative transposon protein TraK [Parapedobacter sp. 10938]
MLNIEKEHKTNRMIAIVAIVGSILFSGFVFLYTHTEIKKVRESIWVLVNGNALEMAMRHNTLDNRPVEIRSHIRIFMDKLFTFSPDGKQIEANIEDAFELSDQSVRSFVNLLKEQKYYDQIIASSASQKLELDTAGIVVDLTSYPYKALVKGTLEIVRPSNVTVRELVCSMDIRNLPERSDRNTHGLMIENFVVNSNETIRSVSRK